MSSIKSEQVDTTYAQWLLSLSSDTLKELVWKDKTLENGVGFSDPDTYISLLTNYLKKCIVGNGITAQVYNYSEKTKVGRRSTKFGLQFCKKNIRGPLSSPFYNDYDMSNCHPTLILHLVKTHLPAAYRVPHLTNYIKNRPQLLKENNLTKTQINSMINKSWNDQSVDVDCHFYHEFQTEILNLQRAFFEKKIDTLEEYEFLKKDLTKGRQGSRNIKARYLNTLICIVEDKILQEAEAAIGEDNVDVLMYDGFFVKKKLNIKDTIKTLNLTTTKYGIQWVHKPHDLSIKLDEDIEPIKTRDQLDLNDYDSLKIDFEEKYKLLRNPTIFVNLYPGIGGSLEMGFNSCADIRLLTAHMSFKVIGKEGKITNIPFFPAWLADPSRQIFTNPVFYPGELPKSSDAFNTFTGFNVNELKCANSSIEKRLNLVEAFNECVNSLTDGQPEYLIKYIAHLFQRPTQLPGIAILFQSEQGFGKDTLRQIIARLMGNKYVHETSDMESIFGSFNSSIANKLLVVLNEMEGKAGFGYKERMKALWTADIIELNEKNVKRWKQQNFMRAFIYSNNKRPIQIPYDDRRYVAYVASDVKPPKEFFDSIYALMDEPEEQLGLYEYLMNIDLSEYAIHDRPKTTAYETIRTANISFIYEFVHDLLNKKIPNITWYEKGKSRYILGNLLFTRYTEWCAEQYIKIDMSSQAHMATTLSNFGVNHSRITLKQCDNKKLYCFSFPDPDFTCNKIEEKKLIQASETIDGVINEMNMDEGSLDHHSYD
tara:strand:+ start:2183 stop:4480 length:2298 start_codon:yes stop_codon:yes gene_type:complete